MNYSTSNELIICNDQELQFSIIHNKKSNDEDNIQQIKEENIKLKQIKDIYEKEINLLKSSILINSLNLNNPGNLKLFHQYSQGEISNNINETNLTLYQKNETFNFLLVKIKNFKQELDLFKEEFLESKTNFVSKMNTLNEKLSTLFKKEIDKRKKNTKTRKTDINE